MLVALFEALIQTEDIEWVWKSELTPHHRPNASSLDKSAPFIYFLSVSHKFILNFKR